MADLLLPGDQWALPLTAGQQLTSPKRDLPLPPRNTLPSIPILTQDTDLTSEPSLTLKLPTYSGFRGGLQRGGPTDADCVEHELRWQGSIEGDANKARHFQEHTSGTTVPSVRTHSAKSIAHHNLPFHREILRPTRKRQSAIAW